MRIGIDLGGSKIEAIALAPNGCELARCREPAPHGNYNATITAIRDLVHAVESQTGQQGTVGIGIPGNLSPQTGLVKNANSTWLIGHAVDHDLAAALNRPVRLANDADCFALSEATDGAGEGAHSVFGAILGTGVGAGITVQGTLLSGPNAIAGEWGHNPLPWPDESEHPGRLCYCGHHSCIETWVSGPALEADYFEATGQTRTAPEINSATTKGDPQAEAALTRYTHRLARALASVINILDPEIIVLGGGLSNVTRLYDEVPGLWTAYVFSDQVATRLVPNHHGDASGVRGAAWLWPDPS